MQDVMKICEDYSQHCFNSNDARGQDIADRILDDVVELPTVDVAEVVRCKDCCDYKNEEYLCKKFDYNMPCDGHCSYGQRIPQKEERNYDS